MTRELLIKFLNDQCSKEELDEVIRWVKSESFQGKSRQWILEDWKSYKEEEYVGSSEKFSALLDKVHHKINTTYDDEEDKKSRSRSLSLFKTWLVRAAAILLLPVLSLLLYTLSETGFEIGRHAEITVDSLKIESPIGSRTEVELTDGSIVHLNSGSRIEYPQNFTGNSREVMLKGEGYFDIVHNPEKPFVVKTGQLDIRARGTIFNVKAYPDEEVIATTLVEGKIIIEKEGSAGSRETIGTLEPEQHVTFNKKNGKITSSKGNIKKYIAWKDGKLVFDNDPIARVAKRLSQIFNVEIIVKDSAKKYTYTVTFVDEPLFQILELMTVATPVEYKVLPRKKLPDGTYSKQKIIIQKKE